MPETVTLTINGLVITVVSGTTVAAAAMKAGLTTFRQSTTGEMRAPLCGMGICYECRLTIDGEPHCRSCQIVCCDGMAVKTDT
jgi:D-hydroxyproline dehydrogenase subunit gamma